MNYEQKYKELHARIALFPGKKKKTVPVFKPKTLSERVAALGVPKVKIVEKPVYLGEPGKKGDMGERGDKGKDGRDGRHGKDDYTPIKGKDYLTPDEIEAIKEEIHSMVLGKIPEPEKMELPKPLEVDQEFVKKIVQIMHSLPENDKLEVSKGIRNAQTFIYGGTKYKVSELMHGGGAVSSTTNSIYNEVVAGSGTAWTLSQTPITGTLRLYVNGQRLMPTVDYSISGTHITTVDSWSAGTLLADYNY